MSRLCLVYLAIFAILMWSTNSSLVYETRPSFILLEEFKQEIFNVQKSKSISKIDLGSYLIFDTTGLGNITLYQIEQQLNYLDVNRLSVEFENDDLVFQGKNGTMSMKYNFNYNTSDGQIFSGNFSLDSLDYTVRKNYELVNGSSLKSYAYLGNFSLTVNDLLFEGEQSLSSVLASALLQLVGDNLEKFRTAYESDINSYYSNMYTNKTVINFKSKSPQLDFTFDLTYDRKPRQFGTYMIFYRMGNINGHDSPHREPAGFKKDSYQMIISKQVFIDFLTDLSFEGLMDYTVTSKNRPNDLPFYIDIQSLGLVLPSLYDSYSRNDECEVWSKLTGFKFNEDKESNKGTFALYTEIYHKRTMRKILTFESNFLVNLKTAINTDDRLINFYVDNSIDITSVKVLSPLSSTVYTSSLLNWVETTFRSYLINNPYYLLERPLDLSSAFKTITSVDNDQNGLVIYGTPQGMKTTFKDDNYKGLIFLEERNKKENSQSTGFLK
jgi:hypothetical protein